MQPPKHQLAHSSRSKPAVTMLNPLLGAAPRPVSRRAWSQMTVYTVALPKSGYGRLASSARRKYQQQVFTSSLLSQGSILVPLSVLW